MRAFCRVILVFSLPLWKINDKKTEVSGKESKPLIGIRGALKISGVPFLLTGFFAYCAAEATAMLWASSYLESVADLPKDEAAALGSLFLSELPREGFCRALFRTSSATIV